MADINSNDFAVKVSVIIPVYNVGAYLKQCMDSVVNQTQEDLEIVCIDDGSTDMSAEILREYAVKDSRIAVYSKPNAGYGHTINYGLERSRGKYIAIVESDDFIDANGIEKLYVCAEENNADYVRSNYYEYNKGKDRLNASLDPYADKKIISAYEDKELFYNIGVSPWACLYKKSFLDGNNIRMNETPGASFQDNSWQFLVLLKATKIVLLKEAYYHYRIDNMSSSVNNSKKVFCVVDEKKYMEEKMEEYQISDISVLTAFARFIFVIYKWNYSRISREYQQVFLMEWKKELLNQKQRGILNREVFNKDQWDEINNILMETDSYYKRTSKVGK